MKLKIGLVFFSLNFLFSYSQEKTIILDNVKKERIPYATVYYLKSKKGYYTNNKGAFEFNKMDVDSVYISCLGYKTLKITTNLIKDTIFLTPEVQLLSEVSIHLKPPKSVKIGFKKKNMNFHAGDNLQFGLTIKPVKEHENSIIKKILIPINKSRFSEKRDFESVLKISLYSCKGNLPDMPLISKPIIINCNQNSNETLIIDIEKENIEFHKNGIFISIEMIGEIDKNGVVINKPFPLPGIKYTDKGTKHFSFIKSFYKPKFSKEWEEMKASTFHLKKEVYLAIQLELSIYED